MPITLTVAAAARFGLWGVVCLLGLIPAARSASTTPVLATKTINPPLVSPTPDKPNFTWIVRGKVEVDGRGIFLPQVVETTPTAVLPELRLGDAPRVGKTLRLSQAQLLQAIHAFAPELVPTSWSGPEEVLILRRTRTLNEAGMKELLTQTLQRDYVGSRGELELRLTRAWPAVAVPDEPLTLRVVDLPTAGITASFVARVEVLAGAEMVGAWQVALQAQIWKDVWVPRSTLARGDVLRDLLRERRDVLTIREPLFDPPKLEAGWEVAQAVSPGMPLLQRYVRLRPVVHRGQVVDAQLRDGPLLISMKVEVLENGAPGELVRVRNPKTRHEFRGKVSDEQTILVAL